MKQAGIVCVPEKQEQRGNGSFFTLLSLGVYLLAWGVICDMTGTAFSPILSVGAAASAALSILPRRKKPLLIAGVIWAVLLVIGGAVFRAAVWDGIKLLANGLFTASQQRQAYIYEMLPVSAPEGRWNGCVQAAMLFLGVLAAPLCAAAGRGRHWASGAVFLLLAGAGAYFGVVPALWLGTGLAALLGLSLLRRSTAPAKGAFLLLAVLITLGGSALLRENPQISVWEEAARDQLALQTVAYAEHWQQEPEPPMPEQEQEEQFYRPEDALADTGGNAGVWAQRLPFVLLVLVVLLVLFVPSILADWLRKRRLQNRRGMDDADNAAAIRAMFLYTFSWLKLGGLEIRNAPYSVYLETLEERYGGFREVLPLWQEAAYSGHAMTGEQRERMRCFTEEIRKTVLTGMNWRERFAAKYIHAL